MVFYCKEAINPRRHRWGVDANPMSFSGIAQKIQADLDGIWHSFASILVTPNLKILSSDQVRSLSYDVIHDVMFGRNRPI